MAQTVENDAQGEPFDVVILGSGSGGENVATLLAEAGRTVALVEDGRVGGECAYVACVPSKAMLRAGQARYEAERLTSVGGAHSDPELEPAADAFTAAAARRDEVSQHRDDTESAAAVRRAGITLVRGHGRVTREGMVRVGDRELAYTDLVIATGSVPSRPDIPGLADVPTWTSDEALSTPRRPATLVVLGGGAVGSELAQSFVRFGTHVVLVEPADQLLGAEHPEVAARLADALRADGVEVRLGVAPERVEQVDAGARLVLEDGSAFVAERILLATGRDPRTADAGLEHLGLTPGKPVDVDEHCRVTGLSGASSGHVWAVGDVTGEQTYTHTASYRARVVAANLLGRDVTADLRAIPRVVYTDPPVASVGLDEQHARDASLDPAVACVDLSELPRAHTDGDLGGLLVLTVDRARKVLIGAAAIGPTADALIAEAVLAVRAEVPLAVLADVVHAFPTYAAAYEIGLQELVAACQD